MKKILMASCAIMMLASPALAGADHKDPDAKAAKKVELYFPKIDTDKDGKVSAAENEAYGKQVFDEADTNNDGFITKEEMTAYTKAEMQKMHSKMN